MNADEHRWQELLLLPNGTDKGDPAGRPYSDER
jgi:hypothetical protein